MLSSSNWREEILKYASADALPTTWNIGTEQRFKADLARPFPFEEENFYCNRKEEVHIFITYVLPQSTPYCDAFSRFVRKKLKRLFRIKIFKVFIFLRLQDFHPMLIGYSNFNLLVVIHS